MQFFSNVSHPKAFQCTTELGRYLTFLLSAWVTIDETSRTEISIFATKSRIIFAIESVTYSVHHTVVIRAMGCLFILLSLPYYSFLSLLSGAQTDYGGSRGHLKWTQLTTQRLILWRDWKLSVAWWQFKDPWARACTREACPLLLSCVSPCSSSPGPFVLFHLEGSLSCVLPPLSLYPFFIMSEFTSTSLPTLSSRPSPQILKGIIVYLPVTATSPPSLQTTSRVHLLIVLLLHFSFTLQTSSIRTHIRHCIIVWFLFCTVQNLESTVVLACSHYVDG